MIGIRYRSLLCCLPLVGLAAAASPTDALSQAPVAPPADPVAACYRAASDGGRDPYPCDLAVQIARDSGSAPAVAAALANRALVLTRLQRFDAALQDLNDAVAALPDHADLHGNRGNLLLRLGRASEALAAHDRAVALAPADPAVYFNRAFAYQALGDPARAAADVESARVLLSGDGLRAADTPGPGAARVE